MKATGKLLLFGTSILCLFFSCDQLLNPEEQNNPPGQPYSPNPYQDQVIQPGDVTLAWSCSDPDNDQLTYDVAFGNNSFPPQVAGRISSNSYYAGNLGGGTWYWKIVAHDPNGGTTEGPVWSFQVSEPTQPPETPHTPDPGDGAQGVSITPTLSWTCGDPETDDYQMDVYFGEGSNPQYVGTLHNERSYFAGWLEPLTTYSWKITAYEGGSEERSEGPLWSFTTEGPGRPNSPQPPDGSQNVSVDADLSWECENSGGNTILYDVYFGLNVDTLMVSQGQQDTYYDPGTMQGGSIYRWHIVARYAGSSVVKILKGKLVPEGSSKSVKSSRKGTVREEAGKTKAPLNSKTLNGQIGSDAVQTDIEGPVWEFWTETPENQPPYEPSNPSPYNGEIGVDPDAGELSWEGGDPEGDWTLYYTYFGTDQYNLQPFSWDRADLTAEFFDLEPNTQYFWQAEARDSHDHSTMGPVWSFWTGVTHRNYPAVPNSPDPYEAQMEVSYEQVTLTWSCTDPDPDGDNVTYELYLSDTGSSADLQIYASDIDDAAYTLTGLTPSGIYMWKIVADDRFGHKTEGPVWYFETAAARTQVIFNDANLEAAVREHFGIYDRPVYDVDVNWATEFSATNRSITDLTGLEYFTNLSSLTLSNNNISSLDRLSQLSNLGTLYLDQNNISDMGAIQWLTNLTDLNLSDNNINNISYVSNLTSLSHFYCSNNPVEVIADLENLPDLLEVSLDGTNVANLGPLFMNVNFANGAALNVTGCPLDIWSKAEYLPRLEHRGVWITTDLDLSAIYFSDLNFDHVVHDMLGVPYTTQLYDSDVYSFIEWDFSYKFILDLSGLQHFTNTTWLDLTYNPSIDDLWPLEWLTGLSTFKLDSSDVSDLSVFATFEEYGPYLDTLVLSRSQITDVSILRSQIGLEYLDIHGNQVQDISALDNPYEVLNVADNPINDLSVIGGDPYLREVDVSDVFTGNLSPLANNTLLEKVRANNIGLADLSMFSAHQVLKHLELRGNAIADLTPLVNNPYFGSGAYLDLTGNPLSADAISIQIPALEAKGVVVVY